jgi:hypothetical protein
MPLLVKLNSIEKSAWRIVGAFEEVISKGILLPGVQLFELMGPILSNLLTDASLPTAEGLLFVKCLGVLLFSNQPSIVIEWIRHNLKRIARSYRIKDILLILAYSNDKSAESLLLDLGNDPEFLDVWNSANYFTALKILKSSQAKEKLFSYIEWHKNIHEFEHNESLAKNLAEIAASDSYYCEKIFAYCSGELSLGQKSLLGDIIFQIGTKEAALAACNLLCDNEKLPTHDLIHILQNIITIQEKTSEHPGAYYIIPSEVNLIRAKLFDLAINDPLRKESALEVLYYIDNERREHGKPLNEKRHPSINSMQPWPLLN